MNFLFLSVTIKRHESLQLLQLSKMYFAVCMLVSKKCSELLERKLSEKTKCLILTPFSLCGEEEVFRNENCVSIFFSCCSFQPKILILSCDIDVYYGRCRCHTKTGARIGKIQVQSMLYGTKSRERGFGKDADGSFLEGKWERAEIPHPVLLALEIGQG